MSKYIVRFVIVAIVSSALAFALLLHTDSEHNGTVRRTQPTVALSTRSILVKPAHQPSDIPPPGPAPSERVEFPETILGSYGGGNTSLAERVSQLRYARDQIELFAEELKDAEYQEDKLRILTQLSRIPPTRTTLDACGRMLADPDPAVKYAAMQILWDFDDPLMAEVLEQLLDRRFAPNLVYTLNQEGRLEEFKQTIEEVIAGAH